MVWFHTNLESRQVTKQVQVTQTIYNTHTYIRKHSHTSHKVQRVTGMWVGQQKLPSEYHGLRVQSTEPYTSLLGLLVYTFSPLCMCRLPWTVPVAPVIPCKVSARVRQDIPGQPVAMVLITH